jgi:hypothetical protein
MRLPKYSRTLLLALAMVPCLLAHAAAPDPAELERFREEQLELRKQIETDARYAHVDQSTRRRLSALQDDAFEHIDAVLAGSQPIEPELSAIEETRDAIAHLTREIELDRPRCRAAPRTGSRMRETTCTSAREREAQRAEAQAVLGKSRGCRGSECGGD